MAESGCRVMPLGFVIEKEPLMLDVDCVPFP